LPALGAWRQRQALPPIRVLAHPQAITTIRRRHRTLRHCVLTPLADGATRRYGPWRITPCEVPHANERFPTYAWKLRDARGTTIVYASDVARLTDRLRRFCRGASLLIVDGAMWRRRLFSHLTIDEALPELATWSVGAILLTQIGRTAPSHAELVERVRKLCRRARPAYDGMVVTLVPRRS
jgi:ribonuclease BN (tRNA processing enzyme)